MACLLEINDCALSLYVNGGVQYQQPAIADVQSKQISFGETALRQARIHPREANQQYLARLNADPLPYPVANAANHADLVFGHLQEFVAKIRDAGGELLLAVPGIMSNDQLGVLLGIIQETGVNVCGFVDSAVAATTTVELPGTTHHIDIHLQRACVTSLSTNADVQRQGAVEIAEVGLSNLLDSWVNVIADRFVRDTRFDPLHSAETEQQLYDQVYDWVLGPGAATAAIPAPEISIDIDYQNHVRHVDFPRSLLEDKAQQRVEYLLDVLPAGGHVTLSARCAKLPGLSQGLSKAGHAVTVLDDNALARAGEKHAAAIRSPDGQLRLVTKLPHDRQAPSQAGSPATTEPTVGQVPTHLLNCASAMATPLHAAAAELPLRTRSRDDGVYLTQGDEDLLINGEAAQDGAALRCGDQISHGEARYLLIAVEP